MEEKKPLSRLWELAEKEHSSFIVAIVLAVIAVLGGIVPYFAVSKVIIELLNGGLDKKYYIYWAMIALLGYIIKAVFYAIALSISHKSTFSVLKEVREKILAKLPRMPLGTIIDTSSGEMKQIIVDQVENMERPLAHLLPEMTANILGPIFILVYLFILDWRMALLSLVSIPVGMLFMGTIMKDYSKQYEGSVQTNASMNAAIVEYIGGIEVIKTFNQSNKSYAKFSDKVIANAAYYYNWMKSCQLPVSLSNVIAPTTFITVLPIGWILYRNGSLGVETFITTIILSVGIAGPLLLAIGFVDSLAIVGTTVSKIDKILKGEEQIHKNEEVILKDFNINLENVRFGYDNDKEIIHGIDMKIKENTLNAFVGPSGSGKSTLVKLIAGYWDIASGSIKIGGYDLKEIPLKQLYDLVSFVSQDNYLFDESIKENIRMGNLKATDEEITQVAKLSGCHDFIMKLEHGYDTVVGSGGSHISGGERQRIAIARAMLKDAPIIVLDEATAYIDPENEAIIQKAVTKLIENKTVIIIAHRLSTIVDADKIFLINDGLLMDSGTHSELLKKSSLYDSMWQAHIGVKDGE